MKVVSLMTSVRSRVRDWPIGRDGIFRDGLWRDFWDPGRGGIDSRDFRDGIWKKIYLGPPFSFFWKIFEKNIKGDQGDFFQFFQKFNHAPVSAW